jgi:Methylamine utilisation protein MauE
MSFAGFAKLFDSQSFLKAIQQLDLVPAPLVFPLMVVVVQCEIWLGLALVVGFRTRIVAATLAGLVSLFIIAIAVALMRGINGDCGCFGSLASEKLGPGLVVRDSLLLCCCLWLSIQKGLNPSDRQKTEETIDYTRIP